MGLPTTPVQRRSYTKAVAFRQSGTVECVSPLSLERCHPLRDTLSRLSCRQSRSDGWRQDGWDAMVAGWVSKGLRRWLHTAGLKQCCQLVNRPSTSQDKLRGQGLVGPHLPQSVLGMTRRRSTCGACISITTRLSLPSLGSGPTFA